MANTATTDRVDHAPKDKHSLQNEQVREKFHAEVHDYLNQGAQDKQKHVSHPNGISSGHHPEGKTHSNGKEYLDIPPVSKDFRKSADQTTGAPSDQHDTSSKDKNGVENGASTRGWLDGRPSFPSQGSVDMMEMFKKAKAEKERREKEAKEKQ